MITDFNQIYFDSVETAVSNVDTLSNVINIMGVDIDDMASQVKKL